MILDSSALVAVLRDEPEHAEFAGLLERNAVAVSAATLVETSIVVGPERFVDLDELLESVEAEVVPFDEGQWRAARDAYVRFGKGSGSRARLDLGDCFSYALAMTTGRPLLFKGEDFTQTDVTPAVTEPR